MKKKILGFKCVTVMTMCLTQNVVLHVFNMCSRIFSKMAVTEPPIAVCISTSAL